MNIKEIIDNLNLINDVIPDYILSRNKGLSDEECEKLAYEAISQSINILEEYQKQKNTKEYILNVCNETYAIYAETKICAINIFLDLCDKYSVTDEIDFKNYWLKLKKDILNNKFQIIENLDFHGVRKL